ncbi:MAG: chromate transporter [Acidobacteria bacterium]|nr:chromate transporter [Acidobacteriota bacterium]
MTTSEQAPKDLVGFLDYYLVQKAPFQIPAEIKELLVKFGPWIALVLLVLSLPGLLLVLGIGTAFMPFGGVGYAAGFTYLTVLLLAQLVLLVMALPGLFKRKMSAWKLMLWSQLVGIVLSLLSGSILGAIIGGLIGLYILFQIRSLYVN